MIATNNFEAMHSLRMYGVHQEENSNNVNREVDSKSISNKQRKESSSTKRRRNKESSSSMREGDPVSSIRLPRATMRLKSKRFSILESYNNAVIIDAIARGRKISMSVTKADINTIHELTKARRSIMQVESGILRHQSNDAHDLMRQKSNETPSGRDKEKEKVQLLLGVDACDVESINYTSAELDMTFSTGKMTLFQVSVT